MSAFDVSWMAGRTVKVTTENGHQWFFELEGRKVCISVECPWRLLHKGQIRLTSEDHNQKYGLPAPIDAAAEANRLLNGSHILSAEIRHGTSDLLVTFEGELKLEAIPVFTGYEAWQVYTPQGRQIIAGCGGELSIC